MIMTITMMAMMIMDMVEEKDVSGETLVQRYR